MTPDGRDLDHAKRAAVEALDEYARLAFAWNTPDDEYTRRAIRALAEHAIRTHDPGGVGDGG